MNTPVTDCPATLVHTHGKTTCHLPAGHEDELHEGVCDVCREDNPDPENGVLEWAAMRGDWLNGPSC